MTVFKKEQRLLKKIEYDSVFNQPSKVVTSEFVFLFRTNDVSHARLGLAISKKVMSRASDRNYIKRILRETFRVRNLPSIDIVVLAKRSIINTDKSALFACVNKAWDKLLIKCEK